MIRDGDDWAMPGNAVQITGGALALDAQPFEKFFKKLLAGGLANRVGPGYIQFFRQKELLEKPVDRAFREQRAGGIGYGMGSRHWKSSVNRIWKECFGGMPKRRTSGKAFGKRRGS
jgi:hypothetical protein